MGAYANLVEEYTQKYGELNRDLFTEEEEVAWVNACNEFYLTEKELKDVYGGPYTDQYEQWYGHPFEIVRAIEPYEEGYDLCALPLFIIRITDMEGDPSDPGEFTAYPEELFVDA